MRLRIPLILFFSLAGFSLLYYTFLQRSLTANFVRLGEEQAVADLSRCVESMRRELRGLDALCQELAGSREVYDVLAGGASGERGAAIIPKVLAGVKVELVYLLDARGRAVLGRVDAPDHAGEIELAAFPPRSAGVPASLAGDRPGESGFLVTEAGILLAVSRPIVRPGTHLGPDGRTRPGEPVGRLVLGRFLTEEVLAGLREQVGEFFFATPLADLGAGHGSGELAGVAPSGPTDRADGVSIERVPQGISARSVLRDIDGLPAIAVSATFPEEAASRGRAALDFGFASVLAAGSFILLALWLVLDLTLVRPLTALTGKIENIRRERDLSQRLAVGSGDEIGALARAFNEMMDEIEEARSEVRDQAFRLGMAEMAAGVLHNVRNSLTPFAGHLQLAKRSLSGAALADLRRAVDELAVDRPGEGDEARRGQLAEFAGLAVDDAASRIEAATSRLEKLALVTKKIESILVEQGRGARRPRQEEALELGACIREGLSLVPEGHLAHMEVVIDPSVAAAPLIRGNAVILQQVFANLVCNAAEAAARAGLRRIRLDVSARLASAGETKNDAEGGQQAAGSMVEAIFSDNGPGFEPELAGRIFERGFSSKQASSGLGLHWCANVVAAMGGAVDAVSAGPGQGATLRVRLRARRAS